MKRENAETLAAWVTAPLWLAGACFFIALRGIDRGIVWLVGRD